MVAFDTPMQLYVKVCQPFLLGAAYKEGLVSQQCLQEGAAPCIACVCPMHSQHSFTITISFP